MKSKILHNWVIKLMALLMAFVAWWLIDQVADPVISRVYSEVPVTFLNEELVTDAGKVYQVENDEHHVLVTLEAKRSVLNRITTENVTATADFMDLELSSLVPVKVKIEGVTGIDRLAIQAEALPTNIKVIIEDTEHKTFPIVPASTGELPEEVALGEMIATPETLSISGPISTIASIKRVEAQVNITGVEEDTALPATIILYDENNLAIDQTLLTISYEDNKEGVEVKVQILDTKAVPLEFSTSGVPQEGYNVASIQVEPPEIVIAAEKEILDSINRITVPSSALDVTDMMGKVDYVIDISEYLPENTRLYDENNNSIAVAVQIDEIGTKSLEIPVQSIMVYENPPSLDFSYATEEALMITFSGVEEVVSALEIKDVRLSVDLSQYKEAGSYTADVQVDTIPGCEVVDKVTVPIILEEK